ncbi:MAG: spermidine synthase [Nocardioides sp.]
MEYDELARAESARGEVVLRERHDPDDPEGTRVLELRVNGVFVMDTLETSTERQLARAALARVDSPRSVVIGGLGLGFTLHEVLDDHRIERVVVVEIEDALVRWMRDGTVPHGPAFLADERVHVVVADIRMAMAEATPSAHDLVLLDVDNGPGYLVYQDNADVYRRRFLAQVAATLRPGGTLVVWSSAESSELADAMADVFGNVEPVPYDVSLVHGTGQVRDERYWLYLSQRRP